MVPDNKNIKTSKKPKPVIEAIRPAKIRAKTATSDRLMAVPFSQVNIIDRFWGKRLETNREITIPSVLEKCRDGRISNFENATVLNKVNFKGVFYDDSDLYKVIEGIAHSLKNHPDTKLEKIADGIIDKIASAQWDDGYINTYYSLPVKQPEKRWGNMGKKHELYCAGHLIEAAIAYYQATRKTKLLDTAIKFADYVDSVFGPDKKRSVPGHQEIELALVKLYRLTKIAKYLNLAKFFLDERGNNHHRKTFGFYSQDHKPVIEQNQAVGHTVRALYMYCAMADVVAESVTNGYLNALNKLWENIVSKKMYITGGVGSRHEYESFGKDYELPNKTAYSETCAAIANIMWNHRMFLLNQHSKYIDVLETVLYNAFAVSVAMSGEKFFYVNPLESDGKFMFNKDSAVHQEWFECSCCPTNIVRFVPTIAGYIYAQHQNALFINLYIGSSLETKISGRTVKLTMKTDYPMNEQIYINIEPDMAAKFPIKLRIPGWSQNKPLPSDLYSYIDNNNSKAAILINGRNVDYSIENGFAVIDRLWNKDDSIEITIPMPIRRVLSHQKVLDNRQKVALQRGPIVYCAEWVDNEIPITDITLPDDAVLRTEYRKDLLNGINVISGDLSENCKFTAIPYYTWAHRGKGQMAVWLKRG